MKWDDTDWGVLGVGVVVVVGELVETSLVKFCECDGL